MTAAPLTEVLLFVLIVIIGGPLAGYLHELTHVAVVTPVADDVRLVREKGFSTADVLNGRAFHVVFDIDESVKRNRVVARLAGLAPLCVGSVFWLLGAHTAVIPGPFSSWPAGGLWSCMAVYTLTGGLSDYLPTVSRARSNQLEQSKQLEQSEQSKQSKQGS